MTASAKTVPGTADHDSCMIAPTVPHCKGPCKDVGPEQTAHTQRWNSVAANRHGIVSRNHSVAAFPPSDCRPALRKDLCALTRSFRFRIPQPPAPRGRQDRVCSHDKEGQRELVLFCLGRFCLCRDVSASTDLFLISENTPSPHPEEPRSGVSKDRGRAASAGPAWFETRARARSSP
jgi:hypothetical protein